MYYSYDKILSLSLEYEPYEFTEETNNIISEIKKLLFIYNKSLPFKITKVHKQPEIQMII